MKIISLVPSITELLFDLGLEDQIIGRTKFCVHPNPKVKEIQQFGGTKKLYLDKIIAAKPDLIIANKEENLKSEVETLQEYFEVLVTDVATLTDNNQMILHIGERTNSLSKAKEIVADINNAFAQLPVFSKKPTALYLIWKEPLMSIGNDTFIHTMLQYAGFENICAEQTRYPQVDENVAPDVVLLSSEPFPFQEKHIAEIQAKFPNAKCLLVDGEMFSWYGSRMRFAPSYFQELRGKL